MIKPLDSGLRRAAPGILPSRRIQDFLSINDEEARIKAIRVPVRVYRFVVIPAKAGIQEGRGGERMAGFAGWRAELSCLLSFPLCGNELYKPLDSGLRRNDGKEDSGLRRAATGVLGGSFQTLLYHLRPVGVPSRRIPDFLSINDGGDED